jgi:hypothetical protein
VLRHRAKGGWHKKTAITEAGMPREWYSEPGADRLGEVLATIFLAALLAMFLFGYLRHFF